MSSGQACYKVLIIALFFLGALTGNIISTPKQPLSTNLSNERRPSEQALVNKMDKEHFTIQPTIGFGLLRFDQSVAEVKSFANIYGKIEADGPLYSDEVWQHGEKMFRDSGKTEEDIARIKKTYMEMRGDQYHMTFERNIILLFDHDRLKDIRLLKANFPVYLGEQDLFALYGEQAARYAADYLQENPRLWEQGIFFAKNGVVMGDYFSEIEDGKVIWSGPPQGADNRAVFLGPANGEYNFDPETTFTFKAIK